MSPQNKRDELILKISECPECGSLKEAVRMGWDACEREIQETTWTANPPREIQLTQRIERLELALKRVKDMVPVGYKITHETIDEALEQKVGE